METKEMIDKMFDLLDDWRRLPAYQLERRADIFFALYLPHIMKARFGAHVDHDHIIPEFPVHKKIVDPDWELNSKGKNPRQLSYKIDYLIICEKRKQVFLIELKTDIGSRNFKQDEVLKEAKKNKLPSLVNGILEILKAPYVDNKYANLIKKLKDFGWITDSGIGLIEDYDIDIVYIQPIEKGSGEIEITFDEIKGYLKDHDDFLTERFVNSLEKWKVKLNFGK